MGYNTKVNRPNEDAMSRIFAKYPYSAGTAILRLAWQAGLLREELTELTWEQVSFLDHQIELPDRAVPLEPELETFLLNMHARWYRSSNYVVFSERFRKKMLPQAISRIARRLLDEEGQTEVRLVDLRHDYVIRQLERHPQAYVARITGVEVRTLQAHFLEYTEKQQVPPPKKEQPAGIDEFKLWKILQAEKDSPAGLALWLTWQLALTSGEIIDLVWEQVDFERHILHLPDRDVPMTTTINRMLEERNAVRTDDPHVMLSENARKPIDLSRLSRITRSALIRGGLENTTIRDLWHCAKRKQQDAAIIDRVMKKGVVSRGEVMELLDLSMSAAHFRLHRLVEEKKLVRVGGKYYLEGTVVPPEKQKEVIFDYLEREGSAYREDIAAILHVQRKQCSLILKRMVDAGELVRVDQKYRLKDA